MADELRRPQCKMCKTVCNVLYCKINSERKFIMKKKIIAIRLAVSGNDVNSCFAENINANYTDNVLSFEQTDENIAVVSCYDENGKLCYSNMYKSEDGNFSADIPKEYKGMKTKVYFVNSKRDKEVSGDDVQPTAKPSVTPDSHVCNRKTVCNNSTDN